MSGSLAQENSLARAPESHAGESGPGRELSHLHRGPYSHRSPGRGQSGPDQGPCLLDPGTAAPAGGSWTPPGSRAPIRAPRGCLGWEQSGAPTPGSPKPQPGGVRPGPGPMELVGTEGCPGPKLQQASRVPGGECVGAGHRCSGPGRRSGPMHVGCVGET